jgi:hypothetical protein
MAKIKSYTDLEQSRKLAEFIPCETADFCWGIDYETLHYNSSPYPMPWKDYTVKEYYVPCWSLTALLGVLPLVDFTTPQLIGTPKTLYRCIYSDNLKSHAYDNAVDACVAMIENLHELNLI